MLSTRLDKWLWAARFYKTRALSRAAIEKGRVKVNDAPAKPSKDIVEGAKVTIRQGFISRTIEVISISDKRNNAAEAEAMYSETSESIDQRKVSMAEQKALQINPLKTKGKPSKRDRRELDKSKWQR